MMMKKLTLHIGSGKTGTTSIQGAFAANRQALEAQGFCYPGDDVCHHWLYFITDQEQSEWPRQFNGLSAARIQEGFNRHLRAIDRDLQKDIDHYILSSEYFFTDDPQAIDSALAFLGNFFDDIEVIAFVRCPVSFYASSQQQKIKASSRLTPPWEYRYNFRAVLEAWGQKAKLKVIGYRPGTDSLAALCPHVGVDGSHFSNEKQQQNTSLSIEQMLLLEKVQRNLYSGSDDVFKPHLGLIHQAKMQGMTKPALKKEVKDHIQRHHAADLEWLRSNHGVEVALHHPDQDSPGEIQLKASLGEAPSVRDVYQVDDDKAEHFEAALVDLLLKRVAKR